MWQKNEMKFFTLKKEKQKYLLKIKHILFELHTTVNILIKIIKKKT